MIGSVAIRALRFERIRRVGGELGGDSSRQGSRRIKSATRDPVSVDGLEVHGYEINRG